MNLTKTTRFICILNYYSNYIMEQKEQAPVCRDRISKRLIQLIKHIGEQLTEIEWIKEENKKQD